MYLEKLRLDGRVAVVTGAGQGIGAACARALGEAGAVVVVADMAADRAEKTAAELKGLGLKAHAATLDVTKSKDVDAVADRTAKEHGRVDILVNNAGVAKSDVRAEDTSDEHWRFHMNVNLDGLFWCCRAFGRHMLAQGSGSIVNIGSMSGFIVNKPQPQSFYNASKAAVHHLTKLARRRMGKARRARQRGRADLYRDAAHVVRHQREPGDVQGVAGDDADGARRPAGGDRLRRALPRLRRREPDDRLDRARRRRLYLLVTTPRPIRTRGPDANRHDPYLRGRLSRQAITSSSTRTASITGTTGRASKVKAGSIEQSLWTSSGSSQSASM